MKKILAFFTLIVFASCAVAQDYKIPLSVNTKFYSGDTVFYQINDINSSDGQVAKLFDEQNADPSNKITPKTDFTSGYTTRDYYPATAVIDLGGTYQLSHEYFYTYLGTDSIYMLFGEPFNWSKDTLRGWGGGSGWKDFKGNITTRYLKIFYRNKGYQKVRELVLYGHLVGDSLSRIPSMLKPLTKTTLTMGQFIGFNQIGPTEVDSVGSAMRHYYQMDWMDTVTTTHVLDDLSFVFSKFGHFDGVSDDKGKPVNYFFPGGVETPIRTGYNFTSGELHRMAQNGVGYFDAIQSVPIYAKGQGKPIDKIIHPDYDATNPNSYDRLARMMWNYAAYYGSIKHPASDMQTPYPDVSGLGLRSYVEAGNEMNQDWSGRDKHFTPFEFIAYSSAFYDGNLGAMGPRMGVKSADPNMFVLEAGTAGASIDYLKGMRFYSYYMRKDHSAPFDALNFHAYATNGTNGKGTNPHAYSPEEYFSLPNNPITNYLKAARELFPGKKVWLTEWGYDRNGKSPNSVARVPGKDSAQVQGDWIARFWVLLSFSGVYRSTIFQLRNDPLKSLYDTLGVNKFNTTGLTDGHYVANQYSKEYATNWFAFPAYYYQRTLWIQLYNYRPDSVVYKNFDSVYVYKYRSADSVAYVIWSGTQTNRKVNYNLNLPDQEVRVVQLADKYFMGVKWKAKGTSIALEISETPLIVFAKDSKVTLTKADTVPPPVDTTPPVDTVPHSVTIKKVIVQYSDGTTKEVE